MPLGRPFVGTGLSEVAFDVTVLALLVPAWYCIGRLAQKVRLPQITGFVIGGVLCGYSGAHLLAI